MSTPIKPGLYWWRASKTSPWDVSRIDESLTPTGEKAGLCVEVFVGRQFWPIKNAEAAFPDSEWGPSLPDGPSGFITKQDFEQWLQNIRDRISELKAMLKEHPRLYSRHEERQQVATGIRWMQEALRLMGDGGDESAD